MTEDKEARDAILKLFVMLQMSVEIGRNGATMADEISYTQAKRAFKEALLAIGATEKDFL